MAKAIQTVINEKLKQDLEEAFADAPDGERLGILQFGRLQDDPEQAHISVTLHVGDPDEPERWVDNINARRNEALDRSHFDVPTFEIGGGSMWWRRGAVKFDFFGTLTGESREEAERKAGVIRATIERAIDLSQRVPGSTDDFGNVVLLIKSVVSAASEGGGEPTQFIWRGKVLWQALVGRAY